MSHKKLLQMFSGFCAVSGSNRLGFMHYCCWPCVCDTQDFLHVDTKCVTTKDGPRVYHFVVMGNKLDEPFFQPFGGGRTTTLRRDAAELRCDSNGHLIGATLSDNGYICFIFFQFRFFSYEIMFFDVPSNEHNATANISAVASTAGKPNPGRVSNIQGVYYQDEYEYSTMCTVRANNGYDSGMGEIFRRVAEISPVDKDFQVPKDISDVDITVPSYIAT
eukprot:GSMAST32.ASY1.ANO1.412.1 assembled CDS